MLDHEAGCSSEHRDEPHQREIDPQPEPVTDRHPAGSIQRQVDGPGIGWTGRLHEIVNGFPEIPFVGVESMGFAASWTQHELWKPGASVNER